MANRGKDVIQRDDVVQAIVIADTYGEEFVPISNDIPLCLLPVVNAPLIDYTLECLSIGGVEETFLFCSSHVEKIKAHIQKNAKKSAGTMKVRIIVSESCRSFGDCLRDIDAKGLLRGSFVLVEPGAIFNMKLLPLIKEHTEVVNKDRGAVMTLVFQEAAVGHISRCPQEEIVMVLNDNQRVLFHKKLGQTRERKVNFPMEIFLENSCVYIRHDLKDSHLAICSSSVLPLFSDNFDFQTKDDFVRGLLMNEEILGSTIYCHIAKGSNYGGAATSWRMYQVMSRGLQNNSFYPLQPPASKNTRLKNDVVVGCNSFVPNSAKLSRTVIGENVKIGENVEIQDSIILSDTKIDNDVIITHSVVGQHCHIKSKSRVTAGSILGNRVVIENSAFVENSLVQSTKPEGCEDKQKIGNHAYRLRIEDADGDEVDAALSGPLSRMLIDEEVSDESDDASDAFTDTDDEELSHTQSPPPDDTKLFFTEVIDSLTRGFEDELQCDNLILEINSSRYAYNVSLKEVNFNVVKAILHMSLRLPTGPQYFVQFVRLLSYFSPILKNYIRNDSAMMDSLKAIEDVAISNENVNEKWVMFVLKWFYDKDHVSEDIVLEWSKALDKKSKFHVQVKPFTDWLAEAEEASSSEEASD